MNWKKGIIFGIALWACMFLVVKLFIALSIYQFSAMRIIMPLVAGVIAFILAGYVKPNKVSAALSYGALWIVIDIILGVLVSGRIIPEVFASFSFWLGYLLVLVAPILKVKKIV